MKAKVKKASKAKPEVKAAPPKQEKPLGYVTRKWEKGRDHNPTCEVLEKE